MECRIIVAFLYIAVLITELKTIMHFYDKFKIKCYKSWSLSPYYQHIVTCFFCFVTSMYLLAPLTFHMPLGDHSLLIWMSELTVYLMLKGQRISQRKCYHLPWYMRSTSPFSTTLTGSSFGLELLVTWQTEFSKIKSQWEFETMNSC